MKELICMLIFAVILTTACAETELSERTNNSWWDDVEEIGHGTITLAYVPSDGFSYEDESGNLTGVTIELMRDFTDFVTSEYDVEITIAFKPIERFSEFYETVKSAEGGVFGVANVTITDDRKNELAFSPPYMSNIATLITHSNIDEINELKDISEKFSGLKALAFEGTLHEERLNQIIKSHLSGAEMEFAHSNNEIIERTASEKNYFAYVDIYNFWRAAERGEPLRRHPAGDEATEQFGVIMPLNSDWHPVMEKFFNQDEGYVHSQRYRNLIEKHLGSELAELLLGHN